MASPGCCASGPPVSSDYQPKGTTSKVGEIDTYFVGEGPNSILVVYDIFGFSPQTKQVCDRLAEAGFNVAMSDHFRGKPWSQDNFPPKDQQAFYGWMGSAGSYSDVVKPDLERLKQHMQTNKGAQKFGIVGFCWGGYMVIQAAGELGWIQAGAMAHPANLSADLAEKVQVPLMILPSKDEPDLTSVFEALQAQPFGSDCVFKRFDNMHHGWCAARGDWSDAAQRDAATEAINLFAGFFLKHVK